MELISRLSRARSQRVVKDVALKLLGDKIDHLCGNQRVTRDDFRNLIVSKNAYFSDRLFQLFNPSGSGNLTKQQIIDNVKAIIYKPVTEKLLFFFRINDIDGDGLISFCELRHLLESCMTENGLVFSEEEINDLTYVLFESADTDQTGTISFDEFQALIAHHPGLIENISISIDRWLLPVPPEPKPLQGYFARKLNLTYIRNNRTSVCFFAVYCVFNLTLFGWRVTEYAEEGKPEPVWIARGAGICLNFNCAFIIFLVLRRTLTFLRTLGINDYFPIDQHIYYHKLCGYLIAFFSIIHTIAHLINFIHLSDERGISLAYFLFNLNPTFKWFYGAASLTGWVCLLSLTIIVVSSLPFVRKSGHFEIFYYCHLFYYVFGISLILHGPSFWMWAALPLLLFIFERFILIKRMFGSTGHTYIERGTILPSRVAHLVIKRPQNFDFRPGDWVYLQIPCIAKWEWHPFTISSAPEMQDYLWLHIRGVGEWTKRVCQIIEQHKDVPFGSVQCKGNPAFVINLKASIPLPVRLDGPYGSPSSHIFNTEHAVLISTGIGVTPFASILQSIMFRYLEARQTCPRCCYSWTDAIPPSVMKLRKVDFVWINREQSSFEWFVHLLSQLEITQAELMEADRFLDMHIYITSAIDNADIRAIGLQLALDLMHSKEERDLITGLKTRTKPGRPRWDEFFDEIQRKNKGRVSLFYCGPPPLGKVLHNYSNQYGFSFHKEIF
ncbi:NADPH oxidase 5 [Tetranychus urticae]|uniref:NADPH oxidase 5 n=1 Tax=Tetranychus urticae TaxID=32264 RepID=T1JRX3_TETUR|nr:NADPH oxidase 5 [Tetranychus urticae]